MLLFKSHVHFVSVSDLEGSYSHDSCSFLFEIILTVLLELPRIMK